MDPVQYKVVHDERRGEPIMSAVFTFLTDLKTNPLFSNDLEYNNFFVKNVQSFGEDVCRIRGHYMLNDLLDNLGMPRIKWGYRYGWLKGDEIKIEVRYFEEIEFMKTKPDKFEVKIYTAGDIWDRL